MQFQEILIIGLGLLASVGIIITGLITHRKRLFLFAAGVSFLSIIQYALIGSMSALLISSIAVVRSSSIAFLETKYPKVNSVPIAVGFVVAYILVFSVGSGWFSQPLPWFEWLPLTGAILGTLAPLFNRMILVKITFITTNINWLIFEFIKGAYGQMVGDTFAIVTNTIAIVYLIIQHNKASVNVSDEEIEDLSTGIIETITRPLEKITTASHKVINNES